MKVLDNITNIGDVIRLGMGMAGVAGILFLIFLSPLLIGQILQWVSIGMENFKLSPPIISAFLYVCLMVGAYVKQKVHCFYMVSRDTWLINILIACAVPFTAWNYFTNV